MVVPIAEITAAAAYCLSAARSSGRHVVAVHVAFTGDDAQTEDLQHRWRVWKPEVPLVTLYSRHRQVGPPLADYVRRLESRRPVVLISETQPDHWWAHSRLDRHGDVIARCLSRTTDATICRIRFPLAAHRSGPRDHQHRR